MRKVSQASHDFTTSLQVGRSWTRKLLRSTCAHGVGHLRRVEIQHLPEIAADMLAANPNLYTDISWVVYDYYIKDNFPDNYKDGNTMDDWVSLCEEYPDRIMVGTDKVGHWKTYPAEVVKYYDLLDRLKPETAKKICHDNILGLVKRY